MFFVGPIHVYCGVFRRTSDFPVWRFVFSDHIEVESFNTEPCDVKMIDDIVRARSHALKWTLSMWILLFYKDHLRTTVNKLIWMRTLRTVRISQKGNLVVWWKTSQNLKVFGIQVNIYTPNLKFTLHHVCRPHPNRLENGWKIED